VPQRPGNFKPDLVENNLKCQKKGDAKKKKIINRYEALEPKVQRVRCPPSDGKKVGAGMGEQSHLKGLRKLVRTCSCWLLKRVERKEEGEMLRGERISK